MKIIKTVARLVIKAQTSEEGFACINGRMNENYGSFGELREKYSVKIDGDIITFKHWGTVTLLANIRTKEVIEYYGQSVSDRDSLNTLARYLRLDVGFRFFPSTGKFIMEKN